MTRAHIEALLDKWAKKLAYDLSPTFIRALAIFIQELPR